MAKTLELEKFDTTLRVGGRDVEVKKNEAREIPRDASKAEIRQRVESLELAVEALEGIQAGEAMQEFAALKKIVDEQERRLAALEKRVK